MNYSKAYFSKDLQDLVYSDIEDYFKEARRETIKIEYKSFNPKGKEKDIFNGIYESICSFLNSQGGILIWGSPTEQKDENHKKFYLGNLSPVDTHYDSDLLINKVTDNIDPIQNFIEVKPLEDNGKFVYVFQVSKGITAYQTNNTFWIRLDGQKRKAPQYYVEALIKQISYPNLEGTIKVIDWEIKSGLIVVNINAYVFNRSPLQNEHNISLRVATPNGRISGNLTNEFTKPHEYYNQNLMETLHYGFPASTKLQISYADTSDLPGFKSKVSMFFGGKLSPMKFCKYTFDFHHSCSSNVNKFFLVNYENENPNQYEDGLYHAIMGD